MSLFDQRLAERLDRFDKAGQRRRLQATAMAANGRAERGDASLVDFSSNDYLGLSRHPLLIERAREWTARLGAGSAASRLVTGTSAEVLAIEARLAAFKGTEAALLFATGWQANAATIPALLAAMPGCAVFADRLAHASMHAGIAAAGARQHRFAHNDLAQLDRLLAEKGAAAQARLILTESVFSMDGTVADLPALAALARRHEAVLYVDEAHATGVFGPRGSGLSATVPGGIDVTMGTFGKALGGFGAYIAGSRVLCDYLANAASGFVFSTALPPAALGATDAALDLVPGMDAERAHLAALGARLRSGLDALGLPFGASASQIVPAVIGAEDAALALSARLAEAGFLASAIRPPTVPPGTSRLRFALKAGHSSEDIDALLAALAAAQ